MFREDGEFVFTNEFDSLVITIALGRCTMRVNTLDSITCALHTDIVIFEPEIRKELANG